MKKRFRYSFCLLIVTVFALLASSAAAETYGRVNYDQVRVRKKMESTDAWVKLNTGDLVQILNRHSYAGTDYYYVTCHNPSHPEREYWGYIDQRYVNLISADQALAASTQAQSVSADTASYAAAAQSETAASAPYAAAVQSGTASAVSASAVGNIRFTARGVNLRKTPSAEAKVLGRFEKGQITAYYGTVKKEGHTWYQVSNGENTGYVMGDYVTVVSAETAAAAAPQQTQTAAAASAAAETSAASAAAASGNIALTTMTKVIVRESGNAKGTQLKLLNSANQVCTLLGNTNTADGYTWYQVQVKGITGWIRGDLLRILSAEEARAYDQTPSGSSVSTSGAVLYTPELADWNSSDIQKIFYKGCVALVTDVKTGISFQVKRWSGGSHADVEPLTASDTAAICRIYGVTDASQITESKNYQRRSILVTVAGHSYAASMYGVPHNASEGNTIQNNNYNGQFCIHFTNSSTHGTKRVDADHQAAVNSAYANAEALLEQLGYTFK